MLAFDNHIINEALISFEFSGLTKNQSDGMAFVDWTKKYVLESIEYHANNLANKNLIIQIPELVINLDIDIQQDFFIESAKLKDYISKQIELAISKQISKDSNTITIQNYEAQIVLDFIETGLAVKQFNVETWKTYLNSFMKELITNKNLLNKWLLSITTIDKFYRFYSLFKLGEIHNLLSKLTETPKIDKPVIRLLKFLSLNKSNFKAMSKVDFYQLLFLALLQSKFNLVRFSEWLILKQLKKEQIFVKDLIIQKEFELEFKNIFKGKIISKNQTQDSVKILKDKTINPISKKEKEFLDAGVAISQAGIVLLAPFISSFLKNTGYLNEKGELKKPTSTPILLHYLATGQTEVPEWELTLPKILSGLPLGQFCKTKLIPTKKLDNQINELLSSVVEHWNALGNVSPEALQETFLHRTGELKVKNGFNYLYVNEKAFDILLTKIPWNFTTIKMNWMPEILFVEWSKT